jgi:peptide/nickel transport system permease protein
MARFIGRRLVALVGLLVLLSFGIFSLLYLAPGSIVDSLLGTRPRTPQLVAELRAEYHLDQGFIGQYLYWLKGVVFHFDFGQSVVTGLPVTQSIEQHAGVTVFLGVYSFVLTVVVGLSVGVVAALRRRSAVDRGLVGVTVFGASMPGFVTGIALLYLLTVRFSVFPSFGPGTGFIDRLVHLTLPAIALAVGLAAVLAKLTRASMIEALDQDYVAFARARGGPPVAIILGYALRNALIPVITASALLLAFLLTGAVFVEITFALPGLGSLLVTSVQQKDIPMVQGLSLVVAAVVMLANLASDLVYVVVDPRIRFDRTEG